MEKTNNFYKMYVDKINKKGGLLNYISHKSNGPIGMMVKRLSYDLKPGSKIIDLGTGTGVLAALLSNKGFNVLAVDNDNEILEIARECSVALKASTKFKHIDMFGLLASLEDKSFDCIVSYGLMEHFSDEDIIKLLRLQIRVSKIVVFCIPGRNIALKYKQKGNGTERYLRLSKWLSLAKFSGANTIVSFGFGYGTKSRYSFLPENFSYNKFTNKFFAKFAGFYEVRLS